MRRHRRHRWLIAGGIVLGLGLLATKLAALVVLAGIGTGLFYGGRALLRHSWRQPVVQVPADTGPCLRCGRLRLDHVFSGGRYLCPVIGEQAVVHEAQWPDPLGELNPRHIPQDVKIAVAARDGGRCRICGSTEELQYDHVIPHSRGGASTVANIQLLCGLHNRQKGARV